MLGGWADKLINSPNMKHCAMNAVKGVIITSRACVILLKLLKGRLSGIADVSQGELNAGLSMAAVTYFMATCHQSVWGRALPER